MLRVRIGWKRRSTRPAPPGVAGWTDARPRNEAGKRDGQGYREADRRESIRLRVVMLLLGTVFLAGTAAALLAERGFLDLRRSGAELRRQRELLLEQVEQVRTLRNQIDALKKNPSATERIAREQLDMVKSGEVVFLLPGDEDESPAQDGEAGKAGRIKAEKAE